MLKEFKPHTKIKIIDATSSPETLPLAFIANNAANVIKSIQ